MNNPFYILGVSYSASDDDVKQAYLRKVREYPPEQHPEQFKIIRNAYEILKSQRERLKYHLFNANLPGFEELFDACVKTSQPSWPQSKFLSGVLAEALMPTKPRQTAK